MYLFDRLRDNMALPSCLICFENVHVPSKGRSDTELCPRGACTVSIHHRCLETLSRQGPLQCLVCRAECDQESADICRAVALSRIEHNAGLARAKRDRRGAAAREARRAAR